MFALNAPFSWSSPSNEGIWCCGVVGAFKDSSRGGRTALEAALNVGGGDFRLLTCWLSVEEIVDGSFGGDFDVCRVLSAEVCPLSIRGPK